MTQHVSSNLPNQLPDSVDLVPPPLGWSAQCGLSLSYGLQLVIRVVHRPSWMGAECPVQDHFGSLAFSRHLPDATGFLSALSIVGTVVDHATTG